MSAGGFPQIAEGGGSPDRRPETVNTDDDKTCGHTPTALCLSLCRNHVEITPDLAKLVTAWPTLPEPVKAGIVAMIDATAGKAGQS